jgi:subtilisin family serine protease
LIKDQSINLNRNNLLKKVLLLLFFFLLSGLTLSQTLSPETIAYRYLVYFKDKGDYKPGDKLEPGSDGYNLAKSFLSEKALWRRAKVLPESEIVNYNDLPVKQEYIDAVRNLGPGINGVSRWFNALSITATKSKLDEIIKLGYVYKIEGVGFLEYAKEERLNRNDLQENKTNYNVKLKYNYGRSYWQNEQIKVPILHYADITGWGVTVGICDNGFNWRNHESLRSRNVKGEYDWIFKDDSVLSQSPPNQFPEDVYDQDGHGTNTMSTLGGFYDGKLIGPAFDVEFYLSKTEDDRTETPVEEDYWLEAVEWMEANGAEVISSSLIYKPYDLPNNQYEYKDMDGKTTTIVRAADYAAYLGVVVCNSMGNERQTKIPSIVSPPDGDSVISAGAVDSTGRIAYFSSNGPTYDGRTKPDVVALGVDDWAAVTKSNTENDSSYSYVSGTSFSCPLTAGVCALILSAHPELTPMQVREALRMTADRKNDPNNVYGWGLVNAYDAVLYWGPVMSNKPEITLDNGKVKVSVFVLSKDMIDKDNAKMYYSPDANDFYAEANLELVEKLDETNSGKYEAVFTENIDFNMMKFYFTAGDADSRVSLPYKAPKKFFIYTKENGKLEVY